MTATNTQYTHSIISVKRWKTRNNDPMWICTTAEGADICVFSNQIGKGIWDNQWVSHFTVMQEGDIQIWETNPIPVSAEFDGKYWSVYDVAPMPANACPDTTPMTDLRLYMGRIKSQIGFWNKEAVRIFDTETTGLNVTTDEIVSFACVDWNETCLRDDEGSSYDNLFIQPQHPEKLLIKGKNGESSYDVHGIHPDQLTDCPTFPDIYNEIADAMAYTHWIAWNAPYDVPLLDNLCIRHNMPLIPRLSVTCAMRLTAPVFQQWDAGKSEYKWQSLENASAFFGIANGGAHNAYADVVMTRSVLKAVSEL